MTRRLAPVLAVGALLSAGCAAAARPALPTSPPAETVRAAKPAVRTAVDRFVTHGQAQYAREVNGRKVQSLLHKIARDPALLRALAISDSAARAYVAQQFPNVWYHWHVARVRIVRGSTVVIERGVPFVVDGPRLELHGRRGRALGTLQISLQDEIGFVRLMRRNYPVDVVVRGTAAAHARSSLSDATHAALPARGTVKLAGRTYAVRAFSETAWNDEPVTIWFLEAA